MSEKKKLQGSARIDFEGPGDILVEVIRQLFQRGATVVATVVLDALFSGERSVEEIVLLINQRGMGITIKATVEIPGQVGGKGEIDPALILADVEETIGAKSGMLQTAEVEPAQVAADDDSGNDDPDNVRRIH